MQPRIVLGSLAFLLVLGAFELAYLALGTPRPVGPVIALVVATLVVLDPGGLLAETPERSR